MSTQATVMTGLVIVALALSGCAVLPTLFEDNNEADVADTSEVLFDFSNAAAINNWFRVNDNVMGGVSQSQIAASDSGTAVFSGDISFQNNGGFATIQSDFSPALDLSVYTGLELRLRGDGKKYGVYLRDSRGRLAYQAVFETQAGQWQVIRLPFAAFEATSFGRPISANPLNTARISSMSIIIEYKQEGNFVLELARIAAYRDQ
jgi:NADH dehydrogenase [ubiquinone] 1 alpha subcomplex assembly factor 1